ncbi:MAG: GNAT family N-acetyltransferase [Myxococcaceae bacterium]
MANASAVLPVIETPRLVLRALEEADAPSIFRYCSVPEIAEHTTWEAHRSLEDSQQFIREVAFKNYARGLPCPFAIVLKEQPDSVVGTVGLVWASESNRCMELGYALDLGLRGKGITVEACRSVMSHVFESVRPERIQARCKTANMASARVMEKLGMQREGVLRAGSLHRGKFVDVYLYSALRAEWTAPAAKAAAGEG